MININIFLILFYINYRKDHYSRFPRITCGQTIAFAQTPIGTSIASTSYYYSLIWGQNWMDFSNCENQESLVDGSGMDGSLYFQEINEYDTFIKK